MSLLNLTRLLCVDAAPTHAQQASAALRSPVHYGLPAASDTQHSMLQELSAGLLQQASVRRTALKAPAAAAAVRYQRPSWPCQLDARRAQRQILQLLAFRPEWREDGLATRMERWAQRSDVVAWRLDSVRRKRKHKMNKHKHRKRRKAQRHKT